MDIEDIKNKLKDYKEVTDIFDLKYMAPVKYITLNDDKEMFSNGGKYISMGDNVFNIKIGMVYKKIPIEFRNNKGKPYYKTRIFSKDILPMTRNNFNELLEVVESQQQVINKLLKKINKYENIMDKI